MSNEAATRPSHLALLYRISQTFSSSLELDEVLNLVLDEVIQAFNAERGFLMLRDQNGTLVFRVARGLDSKTIDDPSFQISRSIIKRVEREKDAILTSDALEDSRFNTEKSVLTLKLRSILCVPIMHKGDMIGLIYVDNRLQSGMFTQDDLNLLTAISFSAAISIENARLYENLQQSKKILEIAYDSTLEGWARALELRDQDTEGHTRRVTDLTVRLAKLFGLNGAELTNIYRGALLHDIGKMAVPDRILRKPGPLTLEELEVMRMHPTYARDMLSKINFLQQVITIPYYHHERWDGTGYPNKIVGRDIPLAARIFAVVDVWDALISNRPYRPPWPSLQAKSYIQEHAGTQFDPQVVTLFMQMLEQDPGLSIE
jgi:putative nucleotidyltransferase with HDIG domain